MIPVTQTKVVIKNSAGEYVSRGNCFAAVVASMIELPITEVPNVEVFYHIDDYPHHYVIMETWLKSKGWELMYDDRYQCFHPDFANRSMGNDEYLGDACVKLKDNLYLASGLSARGVHHICIYKNGKLVWDPHPSREGLVTFENFQTLEKLNNE